MFQKNVPEPSSPLPYQQPTSHEDDVETVVGPSVHVEGDFASEGNILVKGSVSGNVKTSKLLTVEQGAKILANVRAGNAHISGEIKGSVRVQDRLELSSTAQIMGDITCSVLAVEPGALIQGKVSMGGMSMEGIDTESVNKRTRRRRGTEPESEEEEIAE
ncbi:MAG: hypothetical protein COV60_00240 [Candidatus Magasanikbacteria bacterium CG11_big_fil_rev_8_21_14_0_20_43_7]|uniref:Cell shape determination protein CcmA n=1 Tax=Candidatus Magasanikbacteria bacterium CG11_big_fil_rev_8_21_14_0_20_43_7 TaxID=1974654 RepID=A0A2H0N3H9_9BACT|nr:MAG: hypothetical protein COV60_00240 [Candidatus Magasanikbacteria bacterium CG11_big_fil_rev_8_21_14_0_20_43_7]